MPWIPFVTASPSRLETKRAFKVGPATVISWLFEFASVDSLSRDWISCRRYQTSMINIARMPAAPAISQI
jgi:hypothetical protein